MLLMSCFRGAEVDTRMAAKKVSQEALRTMMQKMRSDKGETGKPDLKRKYKLGAKEVALLEQEKRKKTEEKIQEKKIQAKNAGVPENFFDSAKTKAFLNLNKAPQKSILKNSSKPPQRVEEVPKSQSSANEKATGKEWMSKAPVLTNLPVKEKSTKDEMPEDFFDSKKKKVEPEAAVSTEESNDTDLPEGFFDDPIKDAKARGVEYKVSCAVSMQSSSRPVSRTRRTRSGKPSRRRSRWRWVRRSDPIQ
jgi:hypothetical protein